MAITRFVLSICAALLILFLGCQHAAIAYRLRRDGLDPILLPPNNADAITPTVAIAVKHARQQTPRTTDCDITGELISLGWEHSTANITFHSQSFFAAADGSSNRGLYVDPLLAIDKFRSDLNERQAEGCLSDRENERLRRAIVESLPLPPAIAYFLQLGSYDVTGYFDLTPDFRMQVTSPIYRSGVELSPNNLLGYETANYTLIRDGAGSRTQLRLASASEVLIGGTPTEKETLRNELPLSKSPAYFRLLFMAEESASHRLTRAIILSAPDETRLNKAMALRGSTPRDFCATLSVPQVSCTIVPENSGVSPEMRIRVNQKDAFIRVGGMVQEALNLPNDVDPPPSLQVLRPFHGHLIPIKFDPSSEDIMKLILLPGDQILF